MNGMYEEMFGFLAAYIYKRKGLHGLFSCPGFGATTLMMHLIGAAADSGKKSLVFSPAEYDRQEWIEKMRQMKLNTDGVSVRDESALTTETIISTIQEEKPAIVFIDNLFCCDSRDILIERMLLTGSWLQTIRRLNAAAGKLAVPILFNAPLYRATGDWDLFDQRPELMDLLSLLSGEKVDDRFVALSNIDLIMFLHRHHDCERGIGTARRYNVSNHAQLIMKQRYGECFKWDFDFSRLLPD